MVVFPLWQENGRLVCVRNVARKRMKETWDWGRGAYAVVKALEAFGREANRGGSCEVKVAAVEEVEERVLQDFGPDFEVAEVGVAVLEMCGNRHQYSFYVP